MTWLYLTLGALHSDANVLWRWVTSLEGELEVTDVCVQRAASCGDSFTHQLHTVMFVCIEDVARGELSSLQPAVIATATFYQDGWLTTFHLCVCVRVCVK